MMSLFQQGKGQGCSLPAQLSVEQVLFLLQCINLVVFLG